MDKRPPSELGGPGGRVGGHQTAEGSSCWLALSAWPFVTVILKETLGMASMAKHKAVKMAWGPDLKQCHWGGRGHGKPILGRGQFGNW